MERDRRLLLLALGIVVSLWLFGVLTGFVVTGRTQTFDEQMLLALRRAEDPAVPIGPRWGRVIATEITALGSVPVLITIIAAVAGYLALERRFAMAGAVLLASFGGMILNALLKDLFRRPRPTVVPALATVDSSSFPSGHAMTAAVVYLTLGALLARTTTRRRLRLYYVGLALAVSAVVGATRLYLGVHYPTDVLAGLAAGVLWALACELVVHRMQRRGVVESP